jgi:hypothetical protein
VTGLLRPTILIPEAMDQPDNAAELLRLSLLHEIAHAERSDHWFSTAASVAQAIWFFIPHVWWIRSQLLIDQEFLADRSAADRYGTSSDYAAALLSMAAAGPAATAARSQQRGGEATSPGKVGIQSPLFQRMMMLLHCPYPVEPGTPRVWSLASRLAIAVMWITAACLVFRWPHSSLALPSQAVGGTACRFQVDQFVAEPMHDEGSLSGRSLIYVLPVTLPGDFDLDVEVRARRSDLSQIEIAGHPLGDADGAHAAPPVPPASDATSFHAADEPLAWHQVHLRGREHKVSVTDWLTIEPPPQRPAEFRGLKIYW